MTKETMTNKITVEKDERDKGQSYWWKSPEIHKMLRINQTKTVLEVAGELDNKKTPENGLKNSSETMYLGRQKTNIKPRTPTRFLEKALKINNLSNIANNP